MGISQEPNRGGTPETSGTKTPERRGTYPPGAMSHWEEGLDNIAEPPEPELDQPEQDDTPVDYVDDDDRDERQEERDRERVDGDDESEFRPPRARLRIVPLGKGQFTACVQAAGRPASRDAAGTFSELVTHLEELGRVIAREYERELREMESFDDVPIYGRLVQSEVAASLPSAATKKPSTIPPRVSKLASREWVELPSGRLVPLRSFFNPGTKSKDLDGFYKDLTFLRSYSDWPANHAEAGVSYLSFLGKKNRDFEDENHQKSAGESHGRRFSRLAKELRGVLAAAGRSDLTAVATEYVGSRGITANREAMVEAVAILLERLRLNPEK
jgi:hypothetical protein